jgi:protein MpaA
VIPAGRTYHELRERWWALDGRVHVRELACGLPGRALLCVDVGKFKERAVALSAGVHGDEPAGAWALLELVEGGLLDPRCSYRIWPCMNPSGFAAGTRANAEGEDVNRAFSGNGSSPEASLILAANGGLRFALSLDLHEDGDAQGFYCYEYGVGNIGRRVIAGLDARGLPVDPLEVTFDLAGPLDDAHCVRERGRVVPDMAEEAALLGGLSYSLALAGNAARRALTFESPSAAPWPIRLQMHQTAVTAALAALLEESDCVPL